jgi:hypothetical protein
MKKIAAFGLAALVILVALYFGLTSYFEKRIKSQLDARLAELKVNNGVDIGYDKLKVDIFAKSAVMSSVSVRTGDNVTAIDSVTIYGVQDFENNCNIAAKGIDLAGTKEVSKGADVFPSPAKADLRIDFTFDPASKLADLRVFRFFVDNYFDLNVKAKIIDPPSSAASDNLLRFLLELSTARISQAQVTYIDRNLLQYVLTEEARKANSEVEAIAAEYDAALDGQIAKYGQLGSPDAVAILSAVKQFAHDRKGLEIVIAPETPVKIGDVPKDEGQAIALLRMRVKSL